MVGWGGMMRTCHRREGVDEGGGSERVGERMEMRECGEKVSVDVGAGATEWAKQKKKRRKEKKKKKKGRGYKKK